MIAPIKCFIIWTWLALIYLGAATPAARGQIRNPETDLDVGFKVANFKPWWPCFVNLKDGRLIAVGDGYMQRTSTDHGRTWSEKKPLIPEDQRVAGIWAITRLNDGRLGVIVCRMGGLPNQVGLDAENFRTQWLYFQSSDDEGQSWSKPSLINKHNTHGAPHMDTLVQLESGRLVLPVRTTFGVNSKIHKKSGRSGIVAGNEMRMGGHGHYPEMDITFCYLSDDGGKNWIKSDGYIFGWHKKGYGGIWQCDEPVAVDLGSNRVMLLMRTQIGHLYKSVSEDGGYIWSIPEPSGLVSAYAPCMVRRIPATGDLLCVWNQVSPEEMKQGCERSRLSCAISKDNGETWTHFKTIASEPLKPVGRIQAPPGHVRPPEWLGKMPDNYATVDYPNIAFSGDYVLITYNYNPSTRSTSFGPSGGSLWIGFTISSLCEAASISDVGALQA